MVTNRSRKKPSKDIEDFNTINELDLMDMYIVLYPTIGKFHIFVTYTWNIYRY